MHILKLRRATQAEGWVFFISQFPPANPLIPHFFGIMFFFLWIVSFLGNGCVIYIFLKVKSLRTPVRGGSQELNTDRCCL